MELKKRLDLIRSVGEEIITEEDLIKLLEEKKHPIAYDGFEPSGRLHIAQGILRTINVNKMISAGCQFHIWVADWFAWMNNKMGGDIEKIRTTGKYMIEVWKACGMKTDEIKFLWAKDVMRDDEYWKKVVQIARHSSLKRVIRCSQIMGRKESEELSAAQIFYPCMQCADIFHLEADIAQLGMDQRKVNMLARELGPKLGFGKPVAVHHHMIMGLSKPPMVEDATERAIEMKMCKSKPETAIFMEDSEEDIKRKILNAYCPAKQIEENPLMEYAKYMLFERFNTIQIKRPQKFGGDIELASYEELTKIYSEGALHPADLKQAVAFYINELIAPVRGYFEKNTAAAKLMEEVKAFEITR
ncbi:tyrosine--tRNA ligase [Candidatus Woesearchaeota archaeon]|nr:tyrosine--tRNA ligase [Candidatus Woesearchaeota archaeon]